LKSCPICLLKNNILLSNQLVVLDLNLVLIGIYVDHYMDSNGLQNFGIYVDDIIYFSTSDDVKKCFEQLLSDRVSADLMGQVSHFLGIEFAWQHNHDGNITVSLTQQSFSETLIES